MEQHFHREMAEIRERIARLGGHVEHCIGKALMSVKQNDTHLVEQVVKDECIIDEQEVEIEEHCLKILALYQPVAKDLRFIITILKLINDLESMGDLARKIAGKAGKLPRSLFMESQLNLTELGDKTLEMVNLSLNAFLREDTSIAKDILRKEMEVDRMHEDNHRVIAMLIDSRTLRFTEGELMLLSISRSLERIADLATHIAEDVIYLVEAKIMRHHWEEE